MIDRGVSIILVTHAVSMLQRVASRAIVFGEGKIIHDGDLETGCTIYEETMGASDRGKVDQQEPTNQRARVESVDVMDKHGCPQTEFATGDTVCLKIKLGCREPIRDARLIVALCSPVHGTLTSVSTPYQNVKFNLDANGQTVILVFPKIPLLIGAYHFNVSLYGPQPIDFYHRSSGRGLFRIVGPPVNADGYGINGVTRLEHQWEIDGKLMGNK
jgi:hypothetical protein